MNYNYLNGCTSVASVNSRTLQLKESSFKQEQEPFSKEYKILLAEHWNAVVYEVYFPLTSDSVDNTVNTKYIPVKHLVDGGKIRENIVNSLYRKLKENGDKESSLYFKYLHAIKELGTIPREEDLKLIAKLCNYSPGWIHFKMIELKLK